MGIPFAKCNATIVAVAHLHTICEWCGSGSSNRGEQRPVGWGIQRGRCSRWQWFPKAAALPWREESKGGQHSPWQEESNETRGFVAHDFSRKV